jgi:hypothetical protein
MTLLRRGNAVVQIKRIDLALIRNDPVYPRNVVGKALAAHPDLRGTGADGLFDVAVAIHLRVIGQVHVGRVNGTVHCENIKRRFVLGVVRQLRRIALRG